jgi:hypothetical protein
MVVPSLTVTGLVNSFSPILGLVDHIALALPRESAVTDPRDNSPSVMGNSWPRLVLERRKQIFEDAILSAPVYVAFTSGDALRS